MMKKYLNTIGMSKEKNIEKAIKLISEMPQPESSIFVHKLLIAAGIIKPKENDSFWFNKSDEHNGKK
jgi:hypothetical protein